MPFQRKVEYRLYPSLDRASEMARMCDTCRQAYNWALEERIAHYEATRKTLSFAEQCRRLTQERRKRPEWARVHTHALQLALKRLDLAFKHFFRRVKAGEQPGFPRFKSRRRFSGFGFKEHGNGWRLEKRVLRIAGIGRTQARGKARFKGGTPKTCEVICRAGKWYASVTLELAALPARERAGDMISGVDWGVETLATVANSDGTDEAFANPRHLKKQLDALAAAQRVLARRQKGSVRWELARREAACIHDKVRRQRQNYLHQTTAELARTRRVIAAEKLSPKAMSAHGGQAKAGLNREILAASAGAFHQMLAHKAEEAGCAIVLVDPCLHKPSQTCSGGGPARKKPLSDRVHVLPDGTHISRDLNAARNLLNIALGCETQWGGNRPQRSGPEIAPDTGRETPHIAA